MGLKNILNTARKLGIPVVITNDRGESAQVVMPFEDFASMVSGSSHGRSCDCCDEEEDENDADDKDQDILSDDDVEEWSEDPVDEGKYDLTPEEIEELDKIVIEEESEPQSPSEKAPSESSGVSLEDQFYFEP